MVGCAQCGACQETGARSVRTFIGDAVIAAGGTPAAGGMGFAEAVR